MTNTSDLDRRTAQTADLYRQWIEERGTRMTLDERVCEAVAADLVGIPAKSLRSWRAGGLGPVYMKLAGRITYRIADLARWVESGRQETFETLEIKP